MSKQEIRQELSEFLLQYYNGSFSRMACDYIHATGMTEEEVEALLEAMCKEKGTVTRATKNETTYDTMWEYSRKPMRLLTQPLETTCVIHRLYGKIDTQNS